VGRSTPLATDVLVHLRRARDLIDARFGEPLDLAAMASTAGFSRYHFAREFRAAFGEPPGSYLSRRRVERAKVLLTSANLTVTEVCVVVGVRQPQLVHPPVHRACRLQSVRLPATHDRARRATAGAGLLRDELGPTGHRNRGQARPGRPIVASVHKTPIGRAK
jgi:AraC-like DNA-binding protein